MSRKLHTFAGWIPIRRIGALANLHGGAARFCTLLAGRTWAIVLIRRDRTMPSAPAEQRPTLREAIRQAEAAAGQSTPDQP
jgi:hypothetical protein